MGLVQVGGVMLLHVRLLLEALPTRRAAVGPLPGMHAAVRLQVVFGGKLFAAL